MKHDRKINLLLTLTTGIILTALFSCNSTNQPVAPTNKNGLTVSVVTGTSGGNYAPNHVVAIWVENAAGQFVKTLTVYAQARKYDLTNWETASGGNTVDAVTGATKNSHGTISGSWDVTNTQGVVVPDGSYRLCMELTDKGSTGNFSFFIFTKGVAAETQTPGNVPSFSSITIKWVPL